ncbi:efflux RND transporter permease subunit [Novosphingobium mangrovi (ex Huang et al. 2023)]|uniref:Efflux RND transporter permease subunit n=1 Tax=Novosphingobium mangrovi (ex Huang et al. 2023) TaxID=2976432 RepID=A0ABT2I8R5_9SPHN|nr:efflux RND transporter permease subunit [Novosphingobium mangrovi (ex Huang et al. 2023)]MCT2401221.1 efflux RND transporter permease subunit [Novosphingobium mangrovi (ex Huang et al. 2023)]
MSLRNISAWSIRNPIIPIVFFIGVMIAGLVSFNRMDVNNMPDIEFPGVLVRVTQPGAAPTEIETQVTQKIESAARSVPGVEEIQSTASEGSSITTVFFSVGTNADVATNQVKNAVDQIRSDLPDGILEPQVTKIEAGGNELAYFAVSADDMTMEQLSWFVDDTISKALLSVEGLAEVDRNGGVDREIRVVIDPERMNALGVTARDVNNALRLVNTDAAGGQAEIAGSRQSVRVLGNAESAYDLSQTRINLGNGRQIKLSDIARVYDGYSEQNRIAKLQGRQVVTFSFKRALGASDVTVYDGAMEKLKKIEKDNPNIHITRLFAPVDYTKGQYTSSMEALVEGAVLAIVIVYLFLRDWRATFISAIAIPLSAIPTFWFMDMLGFTLNFLSLLALSLVAGVLVDDAIVEIENIVRHMRMGKSAYQASIDAADEIGLAVVATTFSIVAVFLPVGLMPGIPGQFFKAFGLTVVVAVLMSLAVARLITPMVAAYFLKAHGHAEHGGGKAMDLYMKVLAWTLDSSEAHRRKAALVKAPGHWWYYIVATVLMVAILGAGMALAGGIFSVVEAGLKGLGLDKAAFVLAAVAAPLGIPVAVFALGKLSKMGLVAMGRFGDWYRYFADRITARMHDHRFYAFCAGIYALVVTFALLAGLPQQFQPKTNEDFSRVSIEMAPGTTIEQTDAVATRVTRLIEAQPEVERVLQASREGSGTLYIPLKPASERKATSIEFERRLAPQLQEIPDARVNFASQSGGFGSGRDISVMLSGSDSDLLNKTAQTLVEQMRSIPGVVAPRIAADLQRPELVIVPRLDLAAQLGVTTAALSQTIRIATMGEIDQNAAKFSLSDRQVPIRVILGRSSRRDFSTIENLPVATATGGSVPLKRVAEIRFGAGPTQIQRYNQARRIFVGADLGEGQVKGPIMEQIQNLPIMKNLPAGVSNAPVGEDKWQAEMIQNFIIAVISGIFLVFAVLVLLYKRFVSPLVNMASLLLAPLGGLLALTVVGQPISMPVYIGILMLLGIVAKNSILLIDFAIEEMGKGVDKLQAIMDAGHKRAQPIVMTTVAMTAGMVPTALSLSGDGAFRAPMGLTVIGGLLLSTLLTLVIVPAAFSLADGFEKRIGPRLRKALLTFEPHHAEEAHRGQHGGDAVPAE